ncbi:patatin-like phospholipase family protein [Verrucomicrobiota bacterium sgz303538]
MSATVTNDRRFCDMVMKGGITSGVVYPLAAAKLSERFTFKNIGGTSAGAIAAAAAAAAELARDRGGFEKLRSLPTFLSETAPDGSGSNLFSFFQAQPATSRLFRVCLSALGGGSGAIGRVIGRLLAEYAVAALIGAIPFVLFVWPTFGFTGTWYMLLAYGVVGIFLLLTGTSLSVGINAALDLARSLPKNFYGLCTGMTSEFYDVANNPPSGKGKPLTYWLTEYLNSFVGRKPCDDPLTFGDLWGTRDQNASRAINLEMMTTCITHGRPYRLPFRNDDDVRENGLFYFREDEFRKLFPKCVVDWMIAHPRALGRGSSAENREALRQKGFYPLPEPADLPLVVAVRMSLSFPVLLSAIPLHAIDRHRDPKGENPELCWFTDGGLCSNFPIHFFDSPLPRWPTLSLNLVEKPNGTKAEVLLHSDMPASNSEKIRENWNRFEMEERLEGTPGQLRSAPKSGFGKLLGFFNGLITTMQNWTDNTQSRLPGFRDRIAHIGLTPEEGGLNLNMPPERILALTERGEAAAEAFIQRFDVPSTNGTMNWENHRWVRMRSCLASLETMLERMERAMANPQPGDKGYEELARNTAFGADAPSYPWTSREQHTLALEVLNQIRRINSDIEQSAAPNGENPSATEKRTAAKVGPKSGRLAHGAPRPRPELRPRAQI